MPGETSPFVRKLTTLTPLSAEEITFAESLQSDAFTVAAGQELLAEGDAFDHAYVLREGWAFRQRTLADGRRQILSFLLPGDALGLLAAEGYYAPHTVVAKTELSVARVKPTLLRDLPSRYPGLFRALRISLAQDAALLGEQVVRLGRLTAYERLAHMLVELWQRLERLDMTGSPAYHLPVSQAELADALGLTVVHINRTLQRMRADEMIKLHSPHVELLNLDGLIAMAEYDVDLIHTSALV